ncbi:MAG: hypothetical protein HZA31_02315 [Opitutae bacterium]|nr:hypothetical protein [Opitutae bacterium]
MLLIASATVEKLKQVPLQFWVNSAIVILGLVAVILVLRKMREMNKVVLLVILGVVLTLVGFNWIFERNEPAFLTPVIDIVAPFFPSKGRVKPATPPKPRKAMVDRPASESPLAFAGAPRPTC